MTKRMLVDASHAEETRVVVLDGHRLEEFDLEAANRLPLKGNIYLARVVRVEPSLQAAFVEYGGNRHGFLAFGEIHPDYYQIPVADRQRLMAMQAAEAREAEEAEEVAAQRGSHGRRPRPAAPAALPPGEGEQPDVPQTTGYGAAVVVVTEPPDAALFDVTSLGDVASFGDVAPPGDSAPLEAPALPEPAADAASDPERQDVPVAAENMPAGGAAEAAATEADPLDLTDSPAALAQEGAAPDAARWDSAAPAWSARANGHAPDAALDLEVDDPERAPEAPPPETLGGEGPEETADDGPDEGEGRERRSTSRYLRHYKIQEVIRRRQVMLIQVVKEERGTKGAALTTFISLAGRFSVLMPNSPRGGGVSRKITSVSDRKRLREAIDEVGLPDGMSLIVRTAGAQRPKPEIKRDCEYLLRLWDSIRERTLASSAPALIYEEADLIKRSIRDVFSRDVDEVLIEGDDAFQAAHEFMRMLMPQNARRIVAYRDGGVPLFARFQVEAQLDAMHSPVVQLKSGGYIVINQTEALVAIDVNSGRSTRERHIEDTAFRTNCEAAEEIARQLRLRDLAGLIVIDFIDMESSRNDAVVERKLKDALRHDRARIQVGRISHFGLLEMSRQRLRPSLAETTFVTCPHCQGLGQVRSIENAALTVLRAIEEEGGKRRAAEITVHVSPVVALYLLNRKRARLADLEERFGMAVMFEPDATLNGAALRIDRLRPAEPIRVTTETPAALRMDYAPEPEEPIEAVAPTPAEPAAAPGAVAATDEAGEAAKRKRRRRRRRGGSRPGEGQQGAAGEAGGDASTDDDGEDEESEADATALVDGAPPAEPRADASREARVGAEGEPAADAAPRSRSRGRSRTPRTETAPPVPEPVPTVRYQGPTPADPFAGQRDDIFAALEAAEAAAEAEAAARALRPVPMPPPLGAAMPMAGDDVSVAAPDDVPPASAAPAEQVAVVAHPPAEATETVTAPAAVANGAAAQAPLAEASSAQPAAALPASPAEPLQAPPVQPKLVDSIAAEAPKRRGWWAR